MWKHSGENPMSMQLSSHHCSSARTTSVQCQVHVQCQVVQCQVLTRHCHLSTAPVALTVTARGPRSLPCMALSIHSQRPHSTAQALCASTVVCRP